MDEGRFDAAALQAAQTRQQGGAVASWRTSMDAPVASRQLEASWHHYKLQFAAGGELLQRAQAALGAGGGPAMLRALDTAQAAAALTRLHGDLDQLHPFDAECRPALRELLAGFAAAGGWVLDWAPLLAEPAARDRLCVACDREVVSRTFPGLHQGRAMTTQNKAEYEAYARFLAPFAQWPGLAALLAGVLQRT